MAATFLYLCSFPSVAQLFSVIFEHTDKRTVQLSNSNFLKSQNLILLIKT